MKQVPELKKKNRRLADVGEDSLAAALNWDKITGREVRRRGKEYTGDGMMVAWMLPANIAQRLALAKADLPAGSELTPAGDLHLTLAFLGDRESVEVEDLDRLHKALKDFSSTSLPFTGKISGYGRFAADGEQEPLYASFDAPELAAFRQALIGALEAAGVKVNDEHGFTPHITLAYVPADSPVLRLYSPEPIPAKIQEITLALGSERIQFPLSSKVETKAIWDGIKKQLPSKGRRRRSFTVFKDSNDQYRWVLFSSNAYRDRDKEIVSQAALEKDVARADQDGEYGPLRWWHVPGVDIGDCDFNMLHGRMLIESGTFRDPAVARRLARKAKEYQASIGFRHPVDQPDQNGVFTSIRRFERSLVPRGRVANPFTSLTVLKEVPMATMKDKLTAFRKLLGDDDLLQTILAQSTDAQKAIEEAGIEFKQADEDEEEEEEKKPVAAAPAPPVKKPAKGEKPEDEEEEDEDEDEAASYMESEGPYLGDMDPGEFSTLMGTVFSEALHPLIKEIATVKELITRQKDDGAAQQTELAERLDKTEAALKDTQKRLKGLEGDAPKVAAGYIASQADETIVDPERAKELGAPVPDPLDPFIKFVTGQNQ